MNPWVYDASKYFIRYVRQQCLDCRTLHIDRLNREKPYILACTHISHLEPFLLSSIIDKPIHWVARVEMFQFSWAAKLLQLLGAIPIRRNYPSITAIHRSISELNRNRIVGIFPEGEIKRRRDAIIRGGAFKHGLFLISQRANVPIVPAIMIGTEKLNAAEPWLPGSRFPLRIGVGEPVYPAEDYLQLRIAQRKVVRQKLARELSNQFILTYQEMIQKFQIDDKRVP